MFRYLLLTVLIPSVLIAQDEPEADSTRPNLGPMRVIEFETDEGTWTNLDVSPDGQTIAFDLLGDIYTVPVSGGQATRLLEGRAWDQMPSYSPDGSKIAFVSDRDGNMNLWVMNADGSDLEKQSKERVNAHTSPLWTPDGHVIVRRRVRTGSELWLHYLDGGSGVKQPVSGSISGPAISPDGRYLFVAVGGARSAQLVRHDRTTGDSIRLGEGFRPQVSPDGRYLAYAAFHDHRTTLRLRDLLSGADRVLDEEITPAAGRDAQDLLPAYSFTPDGQSIVITIGGKIHRVDVVTGSSQVIPYTAQVTQEIAEPIRVERRVADGDLDVKVLRWASMSPDGETLAFSALGKIYVADLATGQASRLTQSNSREYMPSYSPDGRQITFVTWTDTELGHVIVTDANGRNARTITEIAGRYANPVWSSDGSRIAAMRGGGVEQRGGQPDQETYFDIVWMPSTGGETSYVTSTVASRTVGFPMRYYPVIAFGRNGDRVYYSRWSRGSGPGAAPQTTLYSVRLDGTDLKDHLRFTAFDEIVPSPDGRHVAFVRREQVWLGVLPEFASEAIDLNFESPAIPLRRLTTQGGNYATWQNDSTLAWVFTNRVFRQHVNAEEPDEITRIALTVERPRPNGRIAFTNARLITMEGESVIEDGTIVVDGNRIVAIGRSGEVAVPGDAEVVDARGKTIMPGIVDVHAHMHYAAFETFPEQKWEYIANLAYGVTSTYDPSSHNLDVFAQQEMVEADEMIGPRIFSSGDVIYGTESVFPVVYEDISSIDDARDIVARFTAYSPEMIKEYMQPRRDSRQWLAQAAREHGVMITAEGGGDLVLDMTLVLDGYSAFEHALPIAPLYKDVVELVAESRVHYTPTLIVGYGGATLEQVMVTRENIHENQKLRRFTPEPELDRWRRWQFVPEEEWHFLHIAQSAAKMTKRGGYVTLGAHGNRQGLGAQWELWGLHMGGLTNMEALRSATSLAAEKIGYAEDLGRLGTGMLADFLVLNSNPLEDIRSTADIQYVIKNGVVWDAESMMQIYPERKPLERFFWQTEEEYRRYMATDPTEQGR